MSTPRRMALLISGGVNSKVNHARYANDLERWTRALQSRGFDCSLCFADGSGLSVPGARVRPARRSDIDAELSLIRGLTDGDLVVLLVSNHGDSKGFCTWGTDRVTPGDLSAALDGCAATKVLILGQCYSGVFGSISLPDTVVVTACGPNEPSWACMSPPGAQVYDEFLFQMAEALFGPDSASRGNPVPVGVPGRQASNPGPAATSVAIPTVPDLAPVSLRTAFDRAVVWDRRPETPILADPGGLAHKVVLG